jgi:hypothetical protein
MNGSDTQSGGTQNILEMVKKWDKYNHLYGKYKKGGLSYLLWKHET